MKKLTLLIVAILFSVTAQAQPEWTHTDGPYGGSVWALYTNADGHLFAGTLSKGIYRSTDSGANWTQTNLSNTTVYNFTTAPDGIMFAATQNGVYRSNDSGRTWRQANAGLSETKIQSISAAENGTIFAAVLNAGIYRSTDGGNSWESANNGIELPFGYAVLADGETVYAGVSNRLYVSTNNGDSWTRKAGAFGHSRITDLMISGSSLLAATQSGIFKTDNQGDNWTEVSRGLTNKMVYSLSKNDDGHLFAASRGGIFRSRDNGSTWNLIGSSDVMVYSVAVHPNYIFIGANEGVYYWQQ